MALSFLRYFSQISVDSWINVWRIVKEGQDSQIKELSKALHEVSLCLKELIECYSSEDDMQDDRKALAAHTRLGVYAKELPLIFKELCVSNNINEIAKKIIEISNNDTHLLRSKELIKIREKVVAYSSLISIIYPLNLNKGTKQSRSRRRFFIISGAAAVTSTTAAASAKPASRSLRIVQEFKDVVWELETCLSDYYANQLLAKPPEKLSQYIHSMTAGRFKINIKKLEKPSDDYRSVPQYLMEKVKSGEIPSAYNAVYYDRDNIGTDWVVSCGAPFGLTAQETIAWLTRKKQRDSQFTVVQEYYRNHERYPMHVIPVLTTGMQMGGWFTKEINTVDDLKDLRMRVPGLGATILEKQFGVKVIKHCNEPLSPNGTCPNNNFSSIFPGHLVKNAIANGELDAAEWIGPYEDYKMGLFELSKELDQPLHYYYPGWWEASTTFSLQINLSAWKVLPPSYKTDLELACAKVFHETLGEYNERNAFYLEKLTSSREYQNIHVKPFSKEFLREARMKTDEYLESLVKTSDPFYSEYQEWLSFRNRARAWSQIEAYFVEQTKNI